MEIYVFQKTLSCCNAYFLIFPWFLKMTNKSKSKSLNMKNNWKQWYLKHTVSYQFVDYL